MFQGTALHIAVRMSDTKAVEILLQHGAHPNTGCWNHQLPIEMAIGYKKV